MMWLRDRISKAMGVQDHPDALETLMKEHGEEFQAFLDEEIYEVDEMEKCIFHVYRTFYDRLVEKEVVTIEKGRLHNPGGCSSAFVMLRQYFLMEITKIYFAVPRIMTPPPPVDTDVSKEKKGKKGKGKKGSLKYFSPPSLRFYAKVFFFEIKKRFLKLEKRFSFQL